MADFENEKYGIELVADTGLFKNSLREVSKYVKAFGEGVKESATEQVNKKIAEYKDMAKKFTEAVNKEQEMFKRWRKGENIFDLKREMQQQENKDVETTTTKTGGYEKQIALVRKKLEDLDKTIENEQRLAKVPEEARDMYEQLNQQLAETEEKIKSLEVENELFMKQYPNNFKDTPDFKISELKRAIEERDRIQKNISALETNEDKSINVYKLEAQYEKLENVLNSLLNKQEKFNVAVEVIGDEFDNAEIEEFNEDLEETNDELERTEKTSKNINLGGLFDRSISKIKRFTYYLLGARSVFSLFMKYRNIYYQYNEEMQYQSELSQNAIALSLAPAFEFLGNVIAYASIALAKFIELLTGTNVLSKVSTKGIRDYNKSLKETQTLVSGIDEITNLTNPQNLGLASQYKALEEFQKKVEEVNKWFDDNPWITDIANGLKDIVNYISQHWDIFKYIIGGAILTSIFGLPLVGGVASLIISIGVIGVASAMIEIEKLRNSIDKIKPAHEEEYHIEELNEIDELKDKLKELPKGSKEYNDVLKRMNELWASVYTTTIRGSEDILKYKDEVIDLAQKVDKLTNDTGRYVWAFQNAQSIGEERQKWDERDFFTRWGDWFTNAEERHQELLDFYTDNYNEAFDDILNNYQNMVNEINRTKIDNKVIDIGVKYGIKKSDVQNLINKVRGISVNLFGMPESTFNNIASNVLKNFGFEKGLDYVPYDNFPAVLHKGEAVVPAKYNPIIHSQGNEQTNALLETLIIKVDDLRNRPNQFNIDGKQLARATYPLLRAEANNYTYNEGVSR